MTVRCVRPLEVCISSDENTMDEIVEVQRETKTTNKLIIDLFSSELSGTGGSLQPCCLASNRLWGYFLPSICASVFKKLELADFHLRPAGSRQLNTSLS